jgi:hypothetical protein
MSDPIEILRRFEAASALASREGRHLRQDLYESACAAYGTHEYQSRCDALTAYLQTIKEPK